MALRLNDMLDTACWLVLHEYRWKVPPSQGDKKGECRVGDREDPAWSLIEENKLYPMLDEALRVGGFACLYAKPGFKGCERAFVAEPRLCHDDGNGPDVCKTEPEPVDPLPGEEVARHDKNKATDHEDDDAEVQEEHGIGEKAIRLVCRHLRCLT